MFVVIYILYFFSKKYGKIHKKKTFYLKKMDLAFFHFGPSIFSFFSLFSLFSLPSIFQISFRSALYGQPLVSYENITKKKKGQKNFGDTKVTL